MVAQTADTIKRGPNMTDPEPLTDWSNDELRAMTDHELLAERDKVTKALDDWTKAQDEPWRVVAWKVETRIYAEMTRRYPLATDPLPNLPM